MATKVIPGINTPCSSGKIKYTEDEASSMVEIYDILNNYYRCEVCNCFHVTSMKPDHQSAIERTIRKLGEMMKNGQAIPIKALDRTIYEATHNGTTFRYAYNPMRDRAIVLAVVDPLDKKLAECLLSSKARYVKTVGANVTLQEYIEDGKIYWFYWHKKSKVAKATNKPIEVNISDSGKCIIQSGYEHAIHGSTIRVYGDGGETKITVKVNTNGVVYIDEDHSIRCKLQTRVLDHGKEIKVYKVSNDKESQELTNALALMAGMYTDRQLS